jgi:hypothetical protein
MDADAGDLTAIAGETESDEFHLKPARLVVLGPDKPEKDAVRCNEP